MKHHQHSTNNFFHSCIKTLLTVSIFFLGNLLSCNYTTKKSITKAPSHCTWKNAYVELKHKKGYSRASDMGPRWVSAQDIYTLVVTNGQKTYRFRLNHIKTHKFIIEFAPDCHALAISHDNKKSYYYLALDTKQPFLCQHIRYSGGKSLWQTAPKTRNLVLEILASSSKSLHKNSRNHQIHNKNKTELIGAVQYSLDHIDNPSMRQALLKFIILPGNQYHFVEKILEEKIPAVMDQYPDMRQFIIKSISGAYPRHAAHIFAHYLKPDTTKILAEELNKIYQTKSNNRCRKMMHLTEALAINAALLQNKAGYAVPILGQIAREHKCPLILRPQKYYHYKETWSLNGERSRILAIKALGAIGNPEAIKILQNIAALPCQSLTRIKDTIKVIDNRPRHIWGIKLKPSQISRAYVHTHNLDTIPCWARKVLEAIDK